MRIRISARRNAFFQFMDGNIIRAVSLSGKIIAGFFQRNIADNPAYISCQRIGALGRYAVPYAQIGIVDAFFDILPVI